MNPPSGSFLATMVARAVGMPSAIRPRGRTLPLELLLEHDPGGDTVVGPGRRAPKASAPGVEPGTGPPARSGSDSAGKTATSLPVEPSPSGGPRAVAPDPAPPSTAPFRTVADPVADAPRADRPPGSHSVDIEPEPRRTTAPSPTTESGTRPVAAATTSPLRASEDIVSADPGKGTATGTSVRATGALEEGNPDLPVPAVFPRDVPAPPPAAVSRADVEPVAPPGPASTEVRVHIGRIEVRDPWRGAPARQADPAVDRWATFSELLSARRYQDRGRWP